jgi:hypothetical protein
MGLDEAWQALMPRIRLNKHHGDLNIEIDGSLTTSALEIPAGRIPQAWCAECEIEDESL